MAGKESRIIAVVDGDSFEVQVFQKEKYWVHTKGLPAVVVDFTRNKILSVSYEAKKIGITRDHPANILRKEFPTVKLIRKPVKYEKPDSSLLRKAFYLVREAALDYRQELLKKTEAFTSTEWKEDKIPICFSGCDEFFIDLTEFVNAYYQKEKLDGWELEWDLHGYFIVYEGEDSAFPGSKFHVLPEHITEEEEAQKFLIAAGLMAGLQIRILRLTGYEFSVGIGSNKIRAKIACNLNKPYRVTALPDIAFPRICQKISFRNVQGFGSDLGQELENLFGKVPLVIFQELVQGKFNFLRRKFGSHTADKIKQLSEGFSHEIVEEKLMNTSMSCRRTGRPKSFEDLLKKLRHLSDEMAERIQEEYWFNMREPKKVYFNFAGDPTVFGKSRKRFCLGRLEVGELHSSNDIYGQLFIDGLRGARKVFPDLFSKVTSITEMGITIQKFQPAENIWKPPKASDLIRY